MSGQLRPSPRPDPPAVFEAIWPGFLLLSSEEAGVSIQVPRAWGRSVGVPPDFDQILEGGTGNTGLSVAVPRTATDLESTVDAVLADPEMTGWQPYQRTNEMHGTHRAVRLESRTRADGDFIGGSIRYIVERTGSPPVLVSLGWDSVTDLGILEEEIFLSFNADGSGPAILASYPPGSSSFVTMTDDACRAAGPRLTTEPGSHGLAVANETAHIADLNLLRVGDGYELLAADVEAASEAIAAGREPTWERSKNVTWISDIYLQPGSDGILTAVLSPGIYAVMCFPAGDSDESLGVYLTLPFEVVDPEGP